MEDRLIHQVKRIYHDTKQAINECNFLTKHELDQILLTPSEEESIANVQGSQVSLIKAATLLRELHARFLRTFVLSAFDLTWDMITTPKRFEYAKQKELELFNSLMNIANLKQDEIKLLIRQESSSIAQRVASASSASLLLASTSGGGANGGGGGASSSGELNISQSVNCGDGGGGGAHCSSLDGNNALTNCSNSGSAGGCSASCSAGLHHEHLGEAIATTTVSSSALTRTSSTTASENLLADELLVNFETHNHNHLDGQQHHNEEEQHKQHLNHNSHKQLHNNQQQQQQMEIVSSHSELEAYRQEIQESVLQQLNAAIASKLVGSVESLRNSYVGTLERCLASLEQNFIDNNEPPHALLALRQILNAAYRVEVNVQSSTSILRTLWEKMKQLIGKSLRPIWNPFWTSYGIIDDEWKRQQALDVITKLDESRLARSICAQFRARLKVSHEQFLQSIKDLEQQHAGRLQHTEELRLRVRKMHAPRMAKFALESTSLIDLILYGMPCLEKEIGRGQYGVVYACDSWAGHSPCAVKSVVPPDDKHWHDLAMEFYYTRCIPEHERIVSIFGSVIDHTYGSGSTPAVLLVMQRLNRDLYSAIKSGLDWLLRLQIAIDVVEGIRFLHNQGLVHRDIKLKNILLDEHNRAKITDLGFCKPEAMMSGSVVGTPIHMSPELFSGRYDNSVDVYAFGILFWYICAGHVRLPHIFEQCQTRDQLWNCVRRGVRPERLPQFDIDCWQLMAACWDGDRSKRPHLGDVEIKLRQIYARYN